ncbi:MAG: hypothetical protein ACMUIU_17480 [bacterium]
MKYSVTKFFISVLILTFVMLSITRMHTYAQCLDNQCSDEMAGYGFLLDSESQASVYLAENLSPQNFLMSQQLGQVMLALNEGCTNCEPNPGSIGGGLRMCCHDVFKYNPITKQIEWVTECWIEGCTPLPWPLFLWPGGYPI